MKRTFRQQHQEQEQERKGEGQRRQEPHSSGDFVFLEPSATPELEGWVLPAGTAHYLLLVTWGRQWLGPPSHQAERLVWVGFWVPQKLPVPWAVHRRLNSQVE